MKVINARDLQQYTRAVLDDVERGETFEIKLSMETYFDPGTLITIYIKERASDILHVASAITQSCTHFVTCDFRQASLAKKVNLQVRVINSKNMSFRWSISG